jgi:Cdc6-like AAA superfamily ATPase
MHITCNSRNSFCFSSLYICGSPGTGKTLSVESAVSTVLGLDENGARLVSLNAMSFASNPSGLYAALLEQLRGSKPTSSNSTDAANKIQDLVLQKQALNKGQKKRMM